MSAPSAAEDKGLQSVVRTGIEGRSHEVAGRYAGKHWLRKQGGPGVTYRCLPAAGRAPVVGEEGGIRERVVGGFSCQRRILLGPFLLVAQTGPACLALGCRRFRKLQDKTEINAMSQLSVLSQPSKAD